MSVEHGFRIGSGMTTKAAQFVMAAYARTHGTCDSVMPTRTGIVGTTPFVIPARSGSVGTLRSSFRRTPESKLTLNTVIAAYAGIHFDAAGRP